MEQPDVTVVVVTWNALPWIEQCLDSVRGHETIVVDNGSTDGTVALVRERYPDVRVIEQENKGMGGGNNAGMRVAGGRYFFLLNSDAWVLGDGLDRLVEFADAHPEAAVVGPRLLNTDGTLQRSVRGEPTLWRLATEYFFIRKLAPRTRLLNPLYRGDFAHDEIAEVDWLYGPALLVRREAADAVGPLRRGLLHVQRGGRLADALPRAPAGRCCSSRAPRSCTSAAPRTAAGCTSRTCAGSCASSPSTAA